MNELPDFPWKKKSDTIWENEQENIEILIYTNDDDPDIKCVFMRYLDDKEGWLSNYFPYKVSVWQANPFDFAMQMVSDAKKVTVDSNQNQS